MINETHKEKKTSSTGNGNWVNYLFLAGLPEFEKSAYTS